MKKQKEQRLENSTREDRATTPGGTGVSAGRSYGTIQSREDNERQEGDVNAIRGKGRGVIQVKIEREAAGKVGLASRGRSSERCIHQISRSVRRGLNKVKEIKTEAMLM